MVKIGVVHALETMYCDVTRSLNEAMTMTGAYESSDDGFAPWKTVLHELSRQKELIQLVISRICLVTDAVMYYKTPRRAWQHGNVDQFGVETLVNSE